MPGERARLKVSISSEMIKLTTTWREGYEFSETYTLGQDTFYLGNGRFVFYSTYLNFGLTYRTSERWGLGFSNSYDLSEGYNIGQKLTISRIGESFVISLGASRNESKDNWGVSLSIEPVFMFDKDKKEEGLLGLGNM